MRKLSITFGNDVYFQEFTGQKTIVGPFHIAWWTMDIKDAEQCVDEIKRRLPGAQLSIVSHEPKPYTS